MLNRPQDGQTPVAPAFEGNDWFTVGRVTLLLGVLYLFAFPKLLLGLHTFVYRDYGVLGYPFLFHARETLWAGELPLWNPLSNCGAPFLAQWGTMVLYPFSLLFLLFPLPWSLTYFCFAHLLLGGLGLFVLVRHWLGNSLAATFAAVLYLFNGATFSAMIWPNYLVALGWMPWIVFAAERAGQQGGRWTVLAALAAAMQLLVGTPELVLLTWLIIGALALQAILQRRVPFARLFLRLGTVVVLAGGLIAAQFLPFMELLLQSQRDGSFQSSKWPMPGWGWANLLVPLFHCFQTPQGPFFQHGQEFLTSYYLGIGPLVLAVWAGWTVRTARVYLLCGLTLLGLILALGDQAFLFTWVKQVFPVASVARYPIKFVLLTVFTVPVLAACAIDHLQKSPARPLRSLILVGGGAAVLVGLILAFARAYPFPYDQWKATSTNGMVRLVFLGAAIGGLFYLRNANTHARARWIGVGLVGVFFLDALTHTTRQNPTLPTEVVAPGLWQTVNAPLEPPRLGLGRVYITPRAEAQLLRSGVEDFRQDFLGKRLALWSNLNLLEGIPKINGSSTLQVREQSHVQNLLYAPSTTDPPNGLIRFLGGVLRSSPSNAVEWVSASDAMPLVTAGQQPRFASPEETLRALADPAFDPERVVYLPQSVESVVQTSTLGAARIVSGRYRANRIDLEVEADAPALVVVAQSFYPAWRATVNGTVTPLWRANYAFQALMVPAGSHQVRLIYRDTRFYLGLAISAVTLVFCVILLRRAGGQGTRASPPSKPMPLK